MRPLSEVTVADLALNQVMGFPFIWSELLPPFCHDLKHYTASECVEIMTVG